MSRSPDAARAQFPGRIGSRLADSQPWWPDRPPRRRGTPNILIVLFDDVGFADFGCYGPAIPTPTIDTIAAQGVRMTGFYTTAMCSTTRAALLNGRNHHAVRMGCLANFDSGLPGYRGKISRNAATLAEMLRHVPMPCTTPASPAAMQRRWPRCCGATVTTTT